MIEDKPHWQLDKRFNVSNVLAILSLLGVMLMAYTDTAKNFAIMETRITQNEKVVDLFRQDLAVNLIDLKLEIRELRKEISSQRTANGR